MRGGYLYRNGEGRRPEVRVATGGGFGEEKLSGNGTGVVVGLEEKHTLT